MKTNLLALMLMAMFAVVGCSEAEEMSEEAGSAVGAGADTMAEKVGDMADKADEMADKADEMGEKVGGEMGDKMKEGAGMVKDGAEKLKEAGSDKK